MKNVIILMMLTMMFTLTGCFDSPVRPSSIDNGEDTTISTNISKDIIGVWASAGTIEKSLEGDSLVDESDFYNPLDDDYLNSSIYIFTDNNTFTTKMYESYDSTINIYDYKYRIFDELFIMYENTIGDDTSEEMEIIIKGDSLFFVFEKYNGEIVNGDIFIRYKNDTLPNSWVIK